MYRDNRYSSDKEEGGVATNMKSRWCVVAVVLWIMTIVVLGWFFVKGMTAKGSDGRTEILLAAAERDHILAEMRQLLKAVDGVVRELGEPKPDLKQMEETARGVGMHMAADVEPAIMVKLPLPLLANANEEPGSTAMPTFVADEPTILAY